MSHPVQTQMPDMAHACPLRWWSARQLVTLERLLEEARQQWRDAWIDDCHQTSSALPPIACKAAHESLTEIQDGESWRPLSSSSDIDDENQVWINVHRAQGSMAQLLLKSSTHLKDSSLVEQLSAQALADCLARIDIALTSQSGKPAASHRVTMQARAMPTAQRRPWSGAVHVRFPLSETLSLALHLAPLRVAALLATGTGETAGTHMPPLVALSEALAGHATRLRVELAAVDISVGNLQSLTVGDVLVLPHPLTQTLQVKTAQGMSLCEGYLGQVQGQRAIELIKRAASVQSSNS